MKRWAVTGATGFLGRAVVRRCLDSGEGAAGGAEVAEVLGIVRSQPSDPIEGLRYIAVGDLSGPVDWQAVLAGVEVVVHTAARVHVMADTASDSLAEFRRVNVQGTLQLARAAANAGVKRLVFISSIKVHGEASPPGAPFLPHATAAPEDPYGISKMEAEQGLLRVAADTGMEVVIIRPPLVYGPGVKANFGSLMRAVLRGLPLPLASVKNQRSLVGLDNLVDCVITCARHPRAANEIFLVSDGRDLSTPELIREMAIAGGVTAHLWPLPVWVLQAAGRMLGKGRAVQRLCGNLQVDISKARDVLGWVPPCSVQEGLRRAMISDPHLNLRNRGVVKRLFDLILGVLAAGVLLVPVVLVALAVRLTSKGPALYWSDRVGRNNVIFKMPKFRSMRVGTPAVATHLLGNPAAHLTPIGSFLRKSSLDELPQLWSILRGHMSFVGPRPALFNQHDLVAMRTAAGVHTLMPGLTGWAQVNGRDELPLPAKVALDAAYLQRQSLTFDLQILWLTLVKVIQRDGVSH